MDLRRHKNTVLENQWDFSVIMIDAWTTEWSSKKAIEIPFSADLGTLLACWHTRKPVMILVNPHENPVLSKTGVSTNGFWVVSDEIYTNTVLRFLHIQDYCLVKD